MTNNGAPGRLTLAQLERHLWALRTYSGAPSTPPIYPTSTASTSRPEWADVRRRSTDIGTHLNMASRAIEQRKIAAILSSVDDAIAATRKVIEQTKRVKGVGSGRSGRPIPETMAG
jgi:hypothetical protein